MKKLPIRQLRRPSIRSKLLLSYLLVCLSGLFAFFFASVGHITDLSESNILFSARNTIDQAGEYINFRMNSLKQANYSFAYDADTIRIFSQDADSYPISQQTADIKKLSDRFYQIQLGAPGLITEFHLYLNDSYLYAAPGSDFYMPVSKIENRRWYQIMLETNRASYCIPPCLNDAADMISVVHLISNPHDYSRFIGAVIIDTPERLIRNILKKCAVTQNSVCYLVNAQGLIVSSSDPERADSNLYADEADTVSLALKSGEFCRFDNSLIAARALKSCEWTLILVIPEQDVSALSRSALYTFSLLLLALTALCLIVATLVSSSITRRIKLLSAKMKAFRYEKTHAISAPDSGDDIDHLMVSYNELVSEIETLSAENLKKGRELGQAELSILYTQINPHFLFNTLDMIRALALDGQNDKVAQAMTDLSAFYRRSLNEGKKISTLKSELDHIRAYIDIQNLRFGDSIRLRIDVPDALTGVRLPLITLQPIVENALIHGILQNPDKSGEIVVTARSEGSDALIAVRDNGCGMSSIELSRLMNGESADKGVGFWNTQKRIRLLCGESYGLTADSVPGEYTEITVRVPLTPISAPKGDV